MILHGSRRNNMQPDGCPYHWDGFAGHVYTSHPSFTPTILCDPMDTVRSCHVIEVLSKRVTVEGTKATKV